MSPFSSLPQRIPSTHHHSSSGQNHLTGPIIPTILSFCCNYRSFTSYPRSHLNVPTQIFSSSSTSLPVPFQKLHKTLLKEDPLYRPPLNPFLESPGMSDFVSKFLWGSINILLWGAGIQLWQTKLSWLHASFSDDEPTDHALSSRTGLFSGWPKHYNRPRAKHRLIDVDSGNKPLSTFKLSARFRL